MQDGLLMNFSDVIITSVSNKTVRYLCRACPVKVGPGISKHGHRRNRWKCFATHSFFFNMCPTIGYKVKYLGIIIDH